MRRVLVWACLAASVAYADYRPDRDGAETSVSLAVVDVEGSPVEGAKAVFSVFTSFDECYKLVRDTDSDGRCGIAGKTRGEITVVVMKSGYYPSHGSLKYRDLSWDEAVSEHRWTRGVVANRIVMKPIVDPRKHKYGVMRAKDPPAVNVPLPYDAMIADWCVPYGRGKVCDFKVTCCEGTNAANERAYGLLLYAENCVDGFVRQKTDEWSRFRYALRADPTATFQKSVVIGCVPDEIGAQRSFPNLEQGEYLIFRSRSATNHVGKIVHSNYGVVFESLKFNRQLSMGVQVNPVDNDVSLEDDWVYKHMMKGR